jgi:DNA-binding response OmpR family regulator
MKNILLIDDDEIIQKVLQKVLQQYGYHVIVGIDGREGLAKLDLMHFDVVISDIMMPYLNGFEFIEEVKKHPHGKDAFIIVISSITHEAAIRDGMNLGINLYLPKPIVIDSFVAQIKMLLS